jgi:hypothetical protein
LICFVENIITTPPEIHPYLNKIGTPILDGRSTIFKRWEIFNCKSFFCVNQLQRLLNLSMVNLVPGTKQMTTHFLQYLCCSWMIWRMVPLLSFHHCTSPWNVFRPLISISNSIELFKLIKIELSWMLPCFVHMHLFFIFHLEFWTYE